LESAVCTNCPAVDRQGAVPTLCVIATGSERLCHTFGRLTGLVVGPTCPVASEGFSAVDLREVVAVHASRRAAIRSCTICRSASVHAARRLAFSDRQTTRQLSGSSARDGSSLTGMMWSTTRSVVVPHDSQNGASLRSRLDSRSHAAGRWRSLRLAVVVRLGLQAAHRDPDGIEEPHRKHGRWSVLTGTRGSLGGSRLVDA
jgi:hypothetical protein